jgi:hypothetical protein
LPQAAGWYKGVFTTNRRARYHTSLDYFNENIVGYAVLKKE